MRTGRIGLRQYLYSRNVPDIEDDRCSCGLSPQTIAHVLLNCRQHTRLREEIWTEEDENGRKRRIRTTDLREILSTPACWFLGGAAMWIDLIDTMMHVEGQGEDGGSRVLAAMWLPSWQRAAAKIGATPKLQHGIRHQGSETHEGDRASRAI
jgi:hypothetical protein